MSPKNFMAVLIRQPVDTSWRDDYRRLFQRLHRLELRSAWSLGWRLREEVWLTRISTSCAGNTTLDPILSGLCKSKANYWEGSICIFIALFTFYETIWYH